MNRVPIEVWWHIFDFTDDVRLILTFCHRHRPLVCAALKRHWRAQRYSICSERWTTIDCLEQVQFYHGTELPWCTTDTMDFAASNGHLNIVEWLHTNRKEGCTSWAMDEAAYNGHLHVVEWLHANRVEGCTSTAMVCAAENGHLHIVEYLYNNRAGGCLISAMEQAAKNGHLHVVEWLRAQNSNSSWEFLQIKQFIKWRVITHHKRWHPATCRLLSCDWRKGRSVVTCATTAHFVVLLSINIGTRRIARLFASWNDSPEVHPKWFPFLKPLVKSPLKSLLKGGVLNFDGLVAHQLRLN